MRPPKSSLASITQTSRPAIESRLAAANPATPAPMTTTSVLEGMPDMKLT